MYNKPFLTLWLVACGWWLVWKSGQMKINIGQSILRYNDDRSFANRRRFDALGLVCVNVLASPGAGKTSVIVRLAQALRERGQAVGVIEGDVASSIDTDKLRSLGFPAEQINTDGGCHLDAAMVARATERLGVTGPGFLFIENIGNLICPTQFHLGETLRLVIASTPEGDDKPVKYPGVFESADAVVLNKIDLIDHVDFRTNFFTAAVRTTNPNAPIFPLSARQGLGMEALVEWLTKTSRVAT